MQFLMFMMLFAAVSKAGRIPRSFDVHTGHNFPNLNTVHHGHGATSYQNVDIENHGEISIPTKFHASNHYVHSEDHDHEYQYGISSVTAVPYSFEHEIESHFVLAHDSEPQTLNNIEHFEINNIAANYDHYDYGYH